MIFVAFIRLLIISIYSIDSTCGKHKEFFYFNVIQTVNEKYINATNPPEPCGVSTRDNPCNFTPVIKVILKEDLNRPIIHFRITTFEITGNKSLLYQTLNICSMEKQPGLNIFVRFVTEQLKESTNFKFDCPVRKDYYEVKSFQISPRFDLLKNFFPLNKKHNAYAVVKNSFESKLLETVYSYSVDLEVVEVT